MKGRSEQSQGKRFKIIDSKQTDQKDGGDQNGIIVESRQWGEEGWGQGASFLIKDDKLDEP